ncbi:MAG: hypothetical protein PHU46_14735 [Rhodocyclaceae bacterium]|nr:hypothetical protein [Rhodocyclaceae bacterium]
MIRGFPMFRRSPWLLVALWLTWPSAGAAQIAAGADETLYLVDCAGYVASVRLNHPALDYRRSIREALPETAPGNSACMTENPSFGDGMLTVDVLTDAPPDPEDARYTTIMLPLRGGPPKRVSPPHRLETRPALRGLLERAMATDQGAALRPFSRRAADGSGGDMLLADEAGFSGTTGLARLDASDEGSTAFATLDQAKGTVRVVTGAPRARAGNLFLSPGGRAVLVEEMSNADAAGEATRTSRVVLFDMQSGKPVTDTVLPLLARKDVRVLCVSDRGTMVFGSTQRRRIWIARHGELLSVKVPNDASSRCGFE